MKHIIALGIALGLIVIAWQAGGVLKAAITAGVDRVKAEKATRDPRPIPIPIRRCPPHSSSTSPRAARSPAAWHQQTPTGALPPRYRTRSKVPADHRAGPAGRLPAPRRPGAPGHPAPRRPPSEPRKEITMQPKYRAESGHPNGMQVHRAAFAETAAPVIHRKREPVRWAQLAPYLVACVAVAAAVAVLAVFLAWRTAIQVQVGQLRHQVAATQSQLTSAADAGGSQIARLDQAVTTLRGEVNALDGLAVYTGTCTTDATSSTGRLAVYAVPCRP